jgi:3-methyladenine DNA glycosylase/8-oxoguanine DNA glycosylase
VRSMTAMTHAVRWASATTSYARPTLAGYRAGRGDPTTRLGPHDFWRATHTPDGPGTLHLRWPTGTLEAAAYGPGSAWLLQRVPAMTGALDQGHRFTDAHPQIMQAQRNHPHVRFGASGTLYHELLPTILAQRITGGEAIAQWHRVVHRLGDPAPGPNPLLRLPPSPRRLLGQPRWWFHPLGIESKRIAAMHEVARHADRLWEWAVLSPAQAAAKLQLLPGIGPWTVGTVLATALADPDAVAVGDFHLKNIVASALSGRARGTDEEMLLALEPYAGQRGRVVRLLLADGHRAPAFGPRKRILPMSRW